MTISEPWSSLCTMHLTSQTRRSISTLSSLFHSGHKSLRSCCSTSVTAVTLSNRMQKIRSTVCDPYSIPMADIIVRFLGTRILKNTDSHWQVDKDFRNTFLGLRKAFLDDPTITTEINALQILDDVGIMSAPVGGISMPFSGMPNHLEWVSGRVSDAGTQS